MSDSERLSHNFSSDQSPEPATDELVVVPKAALKQLLERSTQLEEKTAELGREVAELQVLLGELALGNMSIDDGIAADADLDEEAQPQVISIASGGGTTEDEVVLFSAVEQRARIPQEAIEDGISKRGEFMYEIQGLVEPYFNALVGEMGFKAPAHKKKVSRPPAYDENPEAWRKHIKKCGKSVVWKEQDGAKEHSFELQYLPTEQGDRLVGFTSTTELVNRQRRKEDSTTVKLAFDGTQLVEAESTRVESRSSYSAITETYIAMSFGVRPAYTNKIRRAGVYRKIDTLHYDPGVGVLGSFVDADTTREERQKRASVEAMDVYWQLRDNVLGRIPAVSPRS